MVMDKRCPRKLKDYPEEWCSLAVLRLKALRNAGRELTEEEEHNCPGCQWAIAHQLSSYCFFKYAKDYLDGQAISDVEIAYLNSISIETVKKIEKIALDKFKNSDMIKGFRDNYSDEEILGEIRELDVEHSIII